MGLETNTKPPSYRDGFVPNFKFQYISLSQQSLMSPLRAHPGELAVRGNYLCLRQHRTMLSFFFFLQKILYLQILEGALQHFASEIRVFSYTECSLSEQHPGSGQHGLSDSEHKLLGSPQLESTQRRASSGLKYTNIHILGDWPCSLTPSCVHGPASQISLSPDRGERPLQNKGEV